MLMKLTLAILLFAVTVSGNLMPRTRTKKIFDRSLLQDELVVYSTEHTILNLQIPPMTPNDCDISVFFNLAHKTSNNTHVSSGQYVWKNGTVHEILKNGTASTYDYYMNIYLGGKDGIYLYDRNTMSIEKYGPITDSIVQLRHAYGHDFIYILTDSKKMYRVTNNGSVKTNVTNGTCALDFVLDSPGNLFYYCEDKVLNVIDVNGHHNKVSGLPDVIHTAQLLALDYPMFNKVFFVANKVLYKIYANGTSTETDVVVPASPLIQGVNTHSNFVYFAIDGKIYRSNLTELLYINLLGLPTKKLSEVYDTP